MPYSTTLLKICQSSQAEIDKTIASIEYGQAYLTFKIPKRSGKLRTISAPTQQLKKIQKAILSNFLYKFRPHPSSHGFFFNQSPKTNAEVHLGSRLVLNVDLKDFFPSIRLTRIKKLFEYLNTNKSLQLTTEDLIALTKLCGTYSHGLPQGAPTSPMITNLICLQMDKQLTELALNEGYTYTRYADDITFSTENLTKDIGSLYKPISQIVRSHGFKLNRDKSRILRPHRRQEITGVVINKQLTTSKRYRRNLRAQIHNWKTNKFHKTQADLHTERRAILGKISWITSINSSQGQQLLKQLGP